jgi:EAL domain-containing protein (putative c-di-GMP-specific phosphodiesterase class I)
MDNLLYKMNQFIKKYHKSLLIIVIVLLFPLIYAFVYYTGGIKYVYSHTMYIPILLTGIFFGCKYGLLAAVVGGFLLGPLMPLVVETGEPQEAINWIYRLFMFLVVGGFSGYIFDLYRRAHQLNQDLYAKHPDTGIHNINYLMNLEDNYIEGKILIGSIIINNKDRICQVLGTEIYIKAMAVLFDNIKNHLPEPSIIIQVDSDKFWLMFKLNHLTSDGKKIIESLGNELEIDDIKIYIDYSIGVSETEKFKNCKTLLPFRESDRLANYAKDNHLPYVIFDNDLVMRKYEFDLLGVFRKALEREETYLVYQPVIDINTNELVGVEALIRWQHKDKGLIMPNDFIPLVESTQLIHPMTDWVFRKSVKFQKKCRDAGCDFLISINLSPKNLNDPNFYRRVSNIVEEEEANPSQLIFEITETVLLEKDKNSLMNINQLRKQGFKVAIDDFGKGYSSLTYLSHFDTNFLKIDQYYVNQMVDKKSIAQIVEAIVELSHKLNLKVVAEGVETKAMFDKAKSLHIDYVQGFYKARPMKENKMLKWYQEPYKKGDK